MDKLWNHKRGAVFTYKDNCGQPKDEFFEAAEEVSEKEKGERDKREIWKLEKGDVWIVQNNAIKKVRVRHASLSRAQSTTRNCLLQNIDSFFSSINDLSRVNLTLPLHGVF